MPCAPPCPAMPRLSPDPLQGFQRAFRAPGLTNLRRPGPPFQDPTSRIPVFSLCCHLVSSSFLALFYGQGRPYPLPAAAGPRLVGDYVPPFFLSISCWFAALGFPVAFPRFRAPEPLLPRGRSACGVPCVPVQSPRPGPALINFCGPRRCSSW